MREHMEMMGEQMQAMRGMMGDMPMQGQMGGGRMSSGQSMGMSGNQSGQMQEMMGAAAPEMMTRMREQLGHDAADVGADARTAENDDGNERARITLGNRRSHRKCGRRYAGRITRPR